MTGAMGERHRFIANTQASNNPDPNTNDPNHQELGRQDMPVPTPELGAAPVKRVDMGPLRYERAGYTLPESSIRTATGMTMRGSVASTTATVHHLILSNPNLESNIDLKLEVLWDAGA